MVLAILTKSDLYYAIQDRICRQTLRLLQYDVCNRSQANAAYTL